MFNLFKRKKEPMTEEMKKFRKEIDDMAEALGIVKHDWPYYRNKLKAFEQQGLDIIQLKALRNKLDRLQATQATWSRTGRDLIAVKMDEYQWMNDRYIDMDNVTKEEKKIIDKIKSTKIDPKSKYTMTWKEKKIFDKIKYLR